MARTKRAAATTGAKSSEPKKNHSVKIKDVLLKKIDEEEKKAIEAIDKQVDQRVKQLHIDYIALKTDFPVAMLNRALAEIEMETKKKRNIHTYSVDNLKRAVAEVRQLGKLREICKKYGVPKSTVQDRIKGKVSDECRKMGPDPYLSEENEKNIVSWIAELAKCGFPLKKEELLVTVQKIVNDAGIQTPFKNGKPGQTWYKGFLKRHPNLSYKTAESLERSRATVTEEFIKSWFKKLKNYLRDIKALDVLNNPSRLLNADESGFSLCPKTGKVLGIKGLNQYAIKKGREKENVTVLFSFSADGKACPPVVVFPYVRPPKALSDSVPSGWNIGRSDSGWMTSAVFFEFVSNSLNDWLTENNIQRPVLFFVDGHKSHMSMELSSFCSQNGIILYAFPPNCTHILQPADVSLFKPLKEYWRQEVRNWQTAHPNEVVTKINFCPIFEKALRNPNLSQSMKNGFKACGLFPFDPDAVNYNKCVQNTLEKIAENNPDLSYDVITQSDIYSAKKVVLKLKSTLIDNNINTALLITLIASLDPDTHYSTQEDKENGVTVEEYQVAEDGVLFRPDDPNMLQAMESHEIEEHEKYTREEHLNEETNIRGEVLFHKECNSRSEEGIEIEDQIFKNVDIEEECVFEKGKESTKGTEIDIIRDELFEETDEEPLVEKEIGYGKETKIDIPKQGHIVKKINEEILPDENEVQSATKKETYIITQNQILDKTDAESLFEKEKESGMEKLTNTIKEDQEPVLVKAKIARAFTKHLLYPQPLEKKQKRKKEILPSAISSDAWRKYYNDKLKEKEEKENAEKKRKLEKERINVTKPKKRALAKIDENSQAPEIAEKEKQKCAICIEDLESDAEDENDKNVGCDACTRWFHLGCTIFIGLKYAEVAEKDFVCEFCQE